MSDIIDKTPEQEQPCDICQRHAERCICPECSQCGAKGDPSCVLEHSMLGEWIERIKEEAKTPCAGEQLWPQAGAVIFLCDLALRAEKLAPASLVRKTKSAAKL